MRRAPTLVLLLGLAFGSQINESEYPKYNESDAILHYHYALVSFCNKTAIEQWSCGPLCDSLPAPERSIFIGPGKLYDVQGYVAVRPGAEGQRSCSVGFRGSRPGNWRNIVADIAGYAVSWPPSKPGLNTSWCPHCLVDAGFAGAHDELSDDVRSALAELDCTTATFHGHSLGAAVAGLSSMMARGENIVTVPPTWTYGMPRVGNSAFVRAYNDLAAKQGASPPTWRIVHFRDIIPRLNPLMNYWSPRHLPLEVYYSTKTYPGPFEVCPPDPGDPSKENKTCMYKAPFQTWNADDHMHYLGVNFSKMAHNDHCGFQSDQDTSLGGALFGSPAGRTMAAIMAPFTTLSLVLLALACACACPCCCGGCCGHRFCKRMGASVAPKFRAASVCQFSDDNNRRLMNDDETNVAESPAAPKV